MSTTWIEGISNIKKKNGPSCHHSRVLKCKENIYKSKCNNTLKKKLKKYKLRKDGQEDPDIIDVSQTLISSLRIKSPNNQNIDCIKLSEVVNPNNYLTKMVRLKKTTGVVTSAPISPKKCNTDIRNECISQESRCDQDKKETNAFKLLMDSRNKSIGSNSPGKEKCEVDLKIQEKLERKELKAKRILSLNKMAQAKGSLIKKEIEEYRDKVIERKMVDRAKHLKSILVESKTGKKSSPKHTVKKLAENPVNPVIHEVEVHKTEDTLNGNTPILKTFNLFKDNKTPTHNVKELSKEDEDFLKKLSPSIKKKDNMLSYFPKVIKEPEVIQENSESESESKNVNGLVIKVKLKSKTQMKKKKAINKNNLESSVNNELKHSSYEVLNGVIQEKKCSFNIEKGSEIFKTNNDHPMQYHDESRPRRNTKRPVKYADEFHLSSSDEELHIFTPKKKRKGKTLGPIKLSANSPEAIRRDPLTMSKKYIKDKQIKVKEVKEMYKNNDMQRMEQSPSVRSKKYIAMPKKTTKLAPIFVTKPQLDAAALEAKQKFLHSGVPDQLKKSLFQQPNAIATDEFQTVVHVQSIDNTSNKTVGSDFNILKANYVDDTPLVLAKRNVIKNLLLLDPLTQGCNMPHFHNNVDVILRDIKKSYPKFPVYRTYHLLRGKSKGEFNDCVYPHLDNSVEIINNTNTVDINNVHPDKLNWTEKYKPTTEKQVIGNLDSIKELKRWLVTWTENNDKSKKDKTDKSDSSDFYNSDTDSRDILKNENNLLIITGKVGSGKTLSVYAVAAELAIKVIEVNASTKRTGKTMLQDLQEATQSHKVDRAKSSTECSQKSQETDTHKNVLKVMKKRGKNKKICDVSETEAVVTKKHTPEPTVSQENVRTGMSLILIDDADIVFEQDDGFCYAISQLIQSSKRPVILVTSSLTCPHLQKFLPIAKVIQMRLFLPRMLGTWIDIMCLADNKMCSPGLGAKILDLFNGDIRKTINYFQFYMISQRHLGNDNISGSFQEALKRNTDDENSCISWADNEGWGDKYTGSSNSSEMAPNYFVNKELQLLKSSSSLNNYYIWWNLFDTLNCSWKASHEVTVKTTKKSNNAKEIKEMNTIASVLDTLSLTDYWGNSNINKELNILCRPWHTYEADSVLDSENFTSFNRSTECINEISCEVMTKGIALAQKVFDSGNKTICNPSLSIRRERDKVVSRHKILTNHLHLSAALDRRALALDYWSSCRCICRTEKTKTNNNSKRNNRFCHYLKSLIVLCNNDFFDTLGESLSNKKKN